MKELDRQVEISIDNYILTGNDENLDDVMRLFEFYGYPSIHDLNKGE